MNHTQCRIIAIVILLLLIQLAILGYYVTDNQVARYIAGLFIGGFIHWSINLGGYLLSKLSRQ